MSNEDKANRFSYYCNDSVLNKGRAANEAVSKVKLGIKIRKPVYECEGGSELSPKFLFVSPNFSCLIQLNDANKTILGQILGDEKQPSTRVQAYPSACNL